MGKIIELNFSKAEREPQYTIQVAPMGGESVTASYNEHGEYWMIFIRCNSFEDIPRMRGQAMQQLKIKKAVNQGQQ